MLRKEVPACSRLLLADVLLFIPEWYEHPGFLMEKMTVPDTQVWQESYGISCLQIITCQFTASIVCGRLSPVVADVSISPGP